VNLLVKNNVVVMGMRSLQNGIGRVADYSKKPRSSVPSAETIEKPESAQRSFLNRVLRILVVPEKKPGQGISGVELRQNLPFELASLREVAHSDDGRILSLIRNKTRDAAILFPNPKIACAGE
jgi:hypothetical protein